MAEDFSKRSEQEAKTYELFQNYLETSWTTEAALVANVFRAMWSRALTHSKITQIGAAMEGTSPDLDLRATLRKLVAAGVLRSRVMTGVRRWEVNYN